MIADRAWKLPSHYMGEQYPDYVVAYTRHRNSDHADNSNFEFLADLLQGTKCTVDDAVITARASHWAVGWCESLLVHREAAEALELLFEQLRRLDHCPLLDERDYYERQDAEMAETFDAYKSTFISNLEEWLGVDDLDVGEATDVVSVLFQESCDRDGYEDAFVETDEIPMLVRRARDEIERLAKQGSQVARLVLSHGK